MHVFGRPCISTPLHMLLIIIIITPSISSIPSPPPPPGDPKAEMDTLLYSHVKKKVKQKIISTGTVAQ